MNKSVVEDFMNLYSNTIITDGQSSCIILQSNPYKIYWDVWILVLLLGVSIIVPWRVAFNDIEPVEWLVAYLITDSFFLIDIVLTFFTSITKEDEVYETTDKKEIASDYLHGWFWIDLISILPVDIIMQTDKANVSVVARFAKIGKVYKLIRIIRLTKVLKLFRGQNNVMAQFTNKMKMNAGMERLMFFTGFFIFFFHISSCMFIFIAKIDGDTSSWMWDPTYAYMTNMDMYVMSLYFIVTTTSTVGYGDLSASTTVERIYCIVIMLAGVTAFTFISGALSSIL